MRFAVSTMAALETQEDAAGLKLPTQDGVITASTAHTQPALLWAVHSASKLADC